MSDAKNSRTKKCATKIKSVAADVQNVIYSAKGEVMLDKAMSSNVNADNVGAEIARQLEDDVENQISKGHLDTVLNTLNAQAFVLNKVFMDLISKEASSLESNKVYYELALKAQNQCRKTLATMSEVARPKKSTYIAQQNNGQNVQVKNEK